MQRVVNNAYDDKEHRERMDGLLFFFLFSPSGHLLMAIVFYYVVVVVRWCAG